MNPDGPDRLPDACAVAFKEWAGVCRALLSGRQSLILRKGGIEEGPGDFRPEHDAYWLYPTRVHQAEQGLKPGTDVPADDETEPPDGTIGLRGLAVVAGVVSIDDPARLPALDGLHVWTPETVEKRFHYRRPGLWVLGVRVFRRDTPIRLAVTPEQAGCKSWVHLDPALSTAGLAPVLNDAEFRDQLGRLLRAVGSR
jgi:hypothetical protein